MSAATVPLAALANPDSAGPFVAQHPGFTALSNADPLSTEPQLMTWNTSADDPYKTGITHLLDNEFEKSVCGRAWALHGDGETIDPAHVAQVFTDVTCRLCARSRLMRGLGEAVAWAMAAIIEGDRPEPSLPVSGLPGIYTLDNLFAHYCRLDPAIPRQLAYSVGAAALPGTLLHRRVQVAEAVVTVWRTFEDFNDPTRLRWADRWAKLLLSNPAVVAAGTPETFRGLQEVRVLAALERI